MNNMLEGVNGIENEQLLEALRHYSPADVAAMLELFLLNPKNLLKFWSQYCNLASLSSAAGFSKRCFPSDVVDRQQRFSLPVALARNMLPHMPGQDPRKGVPIRVYLKDGTYYPLLFKQGQCDNKYVITHRGRPEIRRWRDVCYAMGLQERDGVRMWVCRHRGSRELCICIAKQVREG